MKNILTKLKDANKNTAENREKLQQQIVKHKTENAREIEQIERSISDLESKIQKQLREEREKMQLNNKQKEAEMESLAERLEEYKNMNDNQRFQAQENYNMVTIGNIFSKLIDNKEILTKKLIPSFDRENPDVNTDGCFSKKQKISPLLRALIK